MICLDQLIDSSITSETDDGHSSVPKLYIHDSKKSKTSSIRDAFVYNLKQQVALSQDIISEVVELGVYENDLS